MAAAFASALVTLTNVTSIAYQLSSLLLYKAAEVSVSTAIALLQRRGYNIADSIGEVQFILMEMDVEAKFKTVRSLLSSLEEENSLGITTGSNDFIKISVTNLNEAMANASLTILRIQEAMDIHTNKWFSSYRRLDVIEDLQTLNAQCCVFDKRLEALIQFLIIPTKDASLFDDSLNSGPMNSVYSGHIKLPAQFENGLSDQRIFTEPYSFMDEYAGVERMKCKMMAERALKDARLQEDVYSDTKTSIIEHQTNVLFEDPVFL